MKSSTLGLQFLVDVGHEVHDAIPLTGDRACVEEGAEECRVSERAGDNTDRKEAGKRPQVKSTKGATTDAFSGSAAEWGPQERRRPCAPPTPRSWDVTKP